MTIDIQQIEKLLAEKKYDEVKALIKEIVSAKQSDKEKGDALIDFASVYMDITNAINVSYKEALEDAIESIKAVNKSENEDIDAADLAKVRGDLNK